MITRLNSLTSPIYRRLPVIVCAALAAWLSGVFLSAAAGKVVTPDKKPDAPPDPPLIIKYEGSERGKYYGKDTMVVYGLNLLTGQEMQFGVVPADSKNYKYNPKPEVTDMLDQMKPGGFAKVKANSKYNENWMDGIDFYKMVPGEELPGNFVFYETYLKNDDNVPPVQIVTLQKFGQAVDVVLPSKLGPDKKTTVIDAGMLATVNAMQKGEVVSVDVLPSDPPVIKSIDPYKAPTEAKMVKVVEADVTDSLKGPAIEVDEDGKSVTLPIRGKVQGKKWMPDNLLLSRAKSLKAGTAILVSTHDEDGKTFVRDLKAAPVQPAAVTGTKTGTSKFDK